MFSTDLVHLWTFESLKHCHILSRRRSNFTTFFSFNFHKVAAFKLEWSSRLVFRGFIGNPSSNLRYEVLNTQTPTISYWVVQTNEVSIQHCEPYRGCGLKALVKEDDVWEKLMAGSLWVCVLWSWYLWLELALTTVSHQIKGMIGGKGLTAWLTDLYRMIHLDIKLFLSLQHILLFLHNPVEFYIMSPTGSGWCAVTLWTMLF